MLTRLRKHLASIRYTYINTVGAPCRCLPFLISVRKRLAGQKALCHIRIRVACTRQETGVRATFQAVLAIRQAHGFAFGKSDLFFCIALTCARPPQLARKGKHSGRRPAPGCACVRGWPVGLRSRAENGAGSSRGTALLLRAPDGLVANLRGCLCLCPPASAPARCASYLLISI